MFLFLLFFSSPRAPRALPSFPTRRSSDLLPRAWYRNCAAAGTSNVSLCWMFTSIPPSNLWLAHSSRHRRRSEEHTSELQSLTNLVCRLLLEKKKNRVESRFHLGTKSFSRG